MPRPFDVRTARQDPRFDLQDFYLFGGSAGNTVMAVTMNPNSGLSSSDAFSEDALYAFRFDLNDDAREEVAFKIRIFRRRAGCQRARTRIVSHLRFDALLRRGPGRAVRAR